MTKGGSVRPMQAGDLREVAERDERIVVLEGQCALFAEQVDRMDKVVKAAKTWHLNDRGFTRITLHNAVSYYITEMARMVKDVE